MKAIYSATLLLLLPFFSSAQESQDPRAKKILDRLSEKNEQYETIQAEFTHEMVNDQDNVNMTEKGKLTLKGDKFVLDLGDQKVVSNGETRWTYLKEDNEVHISSVGEDSEGEGGVIQPSDIFTIWETGFKYEYKGKEEKKEATFHTIDLFPKKPGEKSYHTITLTINDQKETIAKVHVKGKYGTDYIYTVTNMETGEQFKDSRFEFDLSDHPGVEKVDLR